MSAITRSLYAAALVYACGAAHAQEAYPTRTVRLIVPSSPGGGTDASARLISPKLAERLGSRSSSITARGRRP